MAANFLRRVRGVVGVWLDLAAGGRRQAAGGRRQAAGGRRQAAGGSRYEQHASGYVGYEDLDGSVFAACVALVLLISFHCEAIKLSTLGMFLLATRRGSSRFEICAEAGA